MLIPKRQAIFNIFYKYKCHLILQMDLNKQTECLKYELAQVSLVECSEKTEKEDTRKHPDFSLCDMVNCFYMCGCFGD